MPFSELTKQQAKRKSNFQCCICRRPFVEVHHIIPQADGGSDDLDNAAPLCGGCHHQYGGNPELRKQLREMRDHWWDRCANQINDDSINAKLDNLGNDVSAIKDVLIPFMESGLEKLREAKTIPSISAAFADISSGNLSSSQADAVDMHCPNCGSLLFSDDDESYTCRNCNP